MTPVKSRAKITFGIFGKVVIIVGDLIVTLEVFTMRRRVEKHYAEYEYEPFHGLLCPQLLIILFAEKFTNGLFVSLNIFCSFYSLKFFSGIWK